MMTMTTIRVSKAFAARMAAAELELEHASSRSILVARTARYWAADARRCRGNRDFSGFLQSIDLARTDRELASGWRAETKRLRGVVAALHAEAVKRTRRNAASRGRYAAMRSLGLVKTAYGWE